MLQCGFSEVVITPRLDSPIPGSSVERYSNGIKDDLYAKACIIEANGELQAFIVLDAIDIARPEVQAIRKRVAKLTSIPSEHIIVTATHAHTAGPTIRTSYVQAVDNEYLNWLIYKAADAVVLAYQKREPARIGIGLGQEDTISFNRRFHMKDGTVRTNPGVGNPDIVEPTGPIDPDVAILRIDQIGGKTIGIIGNFACHADVVGGLEYSADFPGEWSRTLKALYGEHLVSLFWPGAGGNINHVDPSRQFPLDKESHYRKMGKVLAGETIRVHSQLDPSNTGRFLRKQISIPINYRGPTPRELDAAIQLVQSEEKVKEIELNFAKQAIDLAGREPEAVEVEIQALEIHGAALVFLPAELFVEFGLQIKQHSPYELTIVTQLSNGSVSGYVCTQEAYQQGGYENRLRNYSRLQIEAGDLFVEAALSLLKELKEMEC